MNHAEEPFNEEASSLFAAADLNQDELLSAGQLQTYLQQHPWSLSYCTGKDFPWQELWAQYDQACLLSYRALCAHTLPAPRPHIRGGNPRTGTGL